MALGISLAPEVFESKLQECLADLHGVKVIRDAILAVGYGATDAEAKCRTSIGASKTSKPKA